MAENELIKTDFSSELSQRYLAYALSTITSRSLPDVRDGLKPVHRRLLYAMRLLRLDPGQGFKKSARVVGDVMGKFHPHGDAAIYDAMVRLAQEFAMRYPLVDGQGNFGNIDGDNAAAMRYTEARMTLVAQLLLDGIDEDAVDFRQTYDGEGEEPVILPAAFPNLLANGAQGIAVGMATSIPPHNAIELIDAALHLIKHPNASHAKMLDFIKGPDFPTGGVLIEAHEQLAEAYATGRGAFRLRAAWQCETEKGGGWKIIITAIPYQVQKARLIEKMAELMQSKKLPFIADIMDESAEDIRLVIEPKSRRIDPKLLMENLFRMTDLEYRIGLNLNVLDATGTPGVMSIKDALLAWIEHQLVVLRRRTSHRLGKITARLEVLEGYLVVYLNLDEVIAIIREEDHPRPRLMERFGLNENQANAILDMRLRSLRRLEEMELRKERDDLNAEAADLNAMMADEMRQRAVITSSIKAMRAQFIKTDQRLTQIEPQPVLDSDPADMLVEKEAVTIVCSENGWIRSMKGRIEPDADIRFREGDAAKFHLHADSTDRLVIGLENGRFYTISIEKLPGGRGFGEPLALMIDIAADTPIISIMVVKPGKILLASSSGHGFITEIDQLIAQTKTGRQVMTIMDKARMVAAKPLAGESVALVGSNRKMLIINADDIPVMAKGRGVILQRYKDAWLADATSFNAEDGLSWLQSGGRTRTEKDITPWLGKRASAGKIVPVGFPKPPRFT
ncbi:MAG: DNA topoisomerase IV subunit A [Alphaproteobacteria bacterium]|nr:DNA topoisomerase IV subunit A [Alphaproteobacteria bacterium]